MNKLESPKHTIVRSFLRVAGPVAGVTGLILVLIGFVSFFRAMGGDEPPKYFWCAFLGMPLGFVGLVMCKAGYLGAIVRYVAAESAPVGADTANYMARETQEGVKTVARAAAEGVREGLSSKEPPKVAGPDPQQPR
ncbi:MAG TPA: hypothetical protein VJ063_01130 [Verrucomicrobiae bacterium]|nr:hypothetical protein [Verrucomicrobiae bacterium]